MNQAQALGSTHPSHTDTTEHKVSTDEPFRTWIWFQSVRLPSSGLQSDTNTGGEAAQQMNDSLEASEKSI